MVFFFKVLVANLDTQPAGRCCQSHGSQGAQDSLLLVYFQDLHPQLSNERALWRQLALCKVNASLSCFLFQVTCLHGSVGQSLKSCESLW